MAVVAFPLHMTENTCIHTHIHTVHAYISAPGDKRSEEIYVTSGEIKTHTQERGEEGRAQRHEPVMTLRVSGEGN